MRLFVPSLVALLMLSSGIYGQNGKLFEVNTEEGVALTFKVTDEEAKTCAVYSVGTIAANVGGRVTIPSLASGYHVTAVGSQAFYNCGELIAISIPSEVTTIEKYAFHNCTNLNSVELPSSLLCIEDYAFLSCSRLSNILIPESLTQLGVGVFSNCSSLVSIALPPSVEIIPDNTFFNCKSLANVGNLYVSSIGDNALKNTSLESITIASEEIARMGLGFPDILVFVPTTVYANYLTAEKWSDIANHILPIGCITEYNTILSASATSSALLEAIGEENTKMVMSLSISGTINGNDVIVIRNKMHNLQSLDLSDATIIASGNEYYQGATTSDNIVGKYMFSGLSALKSIKLPAATTSIEASAFYNCSSLQEVSFNTNLKSIGIYAFYGTTKLSTINLPEGLEEIGNNAFGSSGLTTLTLPSTLQTIGQQAFYGCKLSSIIFPQGLQTIGASAFYGNSNLTMVSIPSSVKSIGGNAFAGCSKLKTYYSYTLEPLPVASGTFSNYSTAHLYVPTQSYSLYNLHSEWSKFGTISKFNQAFRYFYLNGDYTLSGRLSGIPDADLFAASSLIVTGDSKQVLGNVSLHGSDSGMASIIHYGNVTVSDLSIEMPVNALRWYFIGLPFDVELSKIEAPGLYVVREYDGELRAAQGGGAWVNLSAEADRLVAGKGYIFQCNTTGTLRLRAMSPSFEGADKTVPLTLHRSDDDEDASWNFVGNPYLAYMDINSLGFDAPITVWNGMGYDAFQPGDDSYVLRPLEAFFVQKPMGVEGIVFPANKRLVCSQSQSESISNAPRKVAMMRALSSIVLEGDNGESDHTRIVFDNTKSTNYEIGTDAAKFLTYSIPQVYSIDGEGIHYAINNLPEREVKLGIHAPKDGIYTFSSSRMDTPLLLCDLQTGAKIDLSECKYSFDVKAGDYNDRFVIIPSSLVDGLSVPCNADDTKVIAAKNGIYVSGYKGGVRIFSISGVPVTSNETDGFVALHPGAYIVEVNGKSSKVIVQP